ncbi:MAG TPA: hypothetical protein PLC40_14945 [Candidatus Hydrogenedentes bacterium]|nr:MAG: hypothetical protein BWY09_00110 [Candidatus Hydrogenedentes bacterium ADurb.Bin179]HOH30974.1 hypothetical protein [Candidatus Hydrogenedentota bacterium]
MWYDMHLEQCILMDDILTELWKIKEAIAAEHGYDIDRLADHLALIDQQGTRQTVCLRGGTSSVEGSIVRDAEGDYSV